MSGKRVLILVAVVAVGLVAAAVPALRSVGRSSPISEVPVYEVRRGEFVRRVHAEGNLEAVHATQLGAPAGIRGSVTIAWLAPNGSRVKQGDVVVRFDPTQMQKNLRDGVSDRATTESRMKQKQVREAGAIVNLERDAEMAVLDLEHAREFQSKDAEIYSRAEIIQSEIDEGLATERKEHADEVRGMRAELAEVDQDLLVIERRKAELQIQRAERELEELEITAPHDGIFVLKEVWGELPEVGSTIWGGNPVAEIPRLDEMKAKVYVLEADAGGLETGLSASVTLDAHPGREYAAKVDKVDALAKRRNRRVPVQYFAAELELERTDPELMKPGQRVQATLLLEELQDVLSVPRQAVMRVDDEQVVYVARGSGFEPVRVELGSMGLGRVVVERGLEEGDVVALRDPTRPLEAPEEDTTSEAPAAGPSVGAGR